MDPTEGQEVGSAFRIYISKYGEPSRTAEFVSRAGPKILVYKWNEDQTDEGVTMYATDGASEVLGTGERSCEFFLGLTPAADDIVEALAEAAMEGNGSGQVPSSGDSITLAFDLWRGTKMRSFLFTDGSELIPSHLETSKRIDFIQLVPLFASELDFKSAHGESALWEKFKANTVPYWDSTRPPAF